MDMYSSVSLQHHNNSDYQTVAQHVVVHDLLPIQQPNSKQLKIMIYSLNDGFTQLKVLYDHSDWWVEASFILSTMKNWRSGKISLKFLMIQSYERTIKSFTVAFFSPLQVNFDLLEMADHGNSCSGA
jgi:hypothetical protein